MADRVRRIDGLRAALAVAPDDMMLRRLLADALEGEARWGEALRERHELSVAEPDSADAKVALAWAYLRAGNRGAAEAVLDGLDAHGQVTPEAWRLRGRLQADAKPVIDDASSDLSEPDPVVELMDWTSAVPIGSPDPGSVAGTRTRGGDGDTFLERPAVRFSDVGGMEDLKEQIRLKIIYPSQHPELFAAYGQRSGGGLLMYGPPGCGKTHLARATAGELGASFVAVGIADVLEMWLGSSERNLHAIFQTARSHTPCVLFFDELDALAAKRSDFGGSAGRQAVNQFLAELDGATEGNEGILILGATNAPWHIDPAFRRPGRFGDVLFVPPPDAVARRQILQVQLRSRPTGKIDLDPVVRATDAFSGADLMGIVERAAQRKLAEAMRANALRPLETGDLLAAVREVSPTTREWFATVRNHVLYANESGLYDAVKPYLR